jgi:hypothetical protein
MHSRQLAVAADAELRRRHPNRPIEPLRSPNQPRSTMPTTSSCTSAPDAKIAEMEVFAPATQATQRPSRARWIRSRTGSGSPSSRWSGPGHADRRPAARGRPARRPGLDHRAARPAGQGAGPGRGPAADSVRPARPADFTSPDFPASAWWPARTRSWRPGGTANGESLLAAAEADLEKIAAACTRACPPLRGQDTIAVRVDQVLAAARSPSTLSPASARTISATAATRTPSPPGPTRSVRPAS